MKICIIGLGSIGKKHLQNIVMVLNLKNVDFTVDAFRNKNKQLPKEVKKLIHKEYFTYEDLPIDYDVIFITNPTIFHYDTIKQVISKTKHMFIEKPVFANLTSNFEELLFNKNNVYYVACPLRHKEIIQYTKTLIEKEQIISVRAICSSYLPKWRKGIDYRNVYSAKKSLGGGVSIDLIHEWDYLTYIFGFPEQIYHFKEKYSNLEIDSDDISVYIGKYSDKLVELHLDYIGQKSVRKLELFTNDRYIEVNLLKNKIVMYKNNKVEKKIKFQEENFYLKEMEYFFNCIFHKTEIINTVENAVHVLKLALNTNELTGEEQ